MNLEYDPATLYRAIGENTSDAIIFAGRDGLIRLWNRGAEVIFGYTAPEAIGQSLDLIIPERLRAAHWRGFRAAMATGTTRLAGRATLTKGLHKSGTSVYVEMSFSVVKDAAHRVLGSVAIARDVTERHRNSRAPATP